MAASYQEYSQRIVRLARSQCEAEEAARNAAQARRAAKRVAMQPEYEAAGQWQDEQIKAHGLCSEVLAEAAAKFAALDALVAAA
jgi:hypothetical protein